MSPTMSLACRYALGACDAVAAPANMLRGRGEEGIKARGLVWVGVWDVHRPLRLLLLRRRGRVASEGLLGRELMVRVVDQVALGWAG